MRRYVCILLLVSCFTCTLRKYWEEKSAKVGPRFYTDEVDEQASRVSHVLVWGHGLCFGCTGTSSSQSPVWNHVRGNYLCFPFALFVNHNCCRFEADPSKRGDKRKERPTNDRRRDPPTYEAPWKKRKALRLTDDWQKKRQCYKCKQWGHIASECKNKPA